MKTTPAKPAHLVEAERQERRDLTERILRLTDRIPNKVLNEMDHRGAVRFKEVAHAARKLASSAHPTLPRLRAAYLSIEGYYRE